jgi:hypothetical protein
MMDATAMLDLIGFLHVVKIQTQTVHGSCYALLGMIHSVGPEEHFSLCCSKLIGAA